MFQSYRDFHSELFPNTSGCESKVNPTQWMQGSDLPVPKISLNPADKQVKVEILYSSLLYLKINNMYNFDVYLIIDLLSEYLH